MAESGAAKLSQISKAWGLLCTKPFDFDEREMKIYEEKKETETFRFIGWEDFSSASVTLPIDKVVADLVKSNKFLVYSL